MSVQLICTCCGSSEDLSLQALKIVHRPFDAWLGLLAGAFISSSAGSAATFLGLSEAVSLFRMVAFAGFTLGFLYYTLRSTSAIYNLLFCEACWRKISGREFNRMAIKGGLVVLAVGGAITVSAVMKSDDYIYLPAVAAAILGVIAWYFKLFAKPRFVSIGEQTSVIRIPDLGDVEVNSQ
jgi:hypothetical protein